MERQFYFGKIALRGNRKENAVDVTIELKEYENKQPVFTASGRVWNRTHTNLRLGGQCLDEIAKYIKNPVMTMVRNTPSVAIDIPLRIMGFVSLSDVSRPPDSRIMVMAR